MPCGCEVQSGCGRTLRLRLEARERTLGQDHPQTLDTKYNLACRVLFFFFHLSFLFFLLNESV